MNNELEKGKGQRTNKEVKHGAKGLGWRRDSGKQQQQKKKNSENGEINRGDNQYLISQQNVYKIIIKPGKRT